MNKKIILFFILVLSFTNIIKSAAIDDKILGIEQDVIKLRNEIEKGFQNRCDTQIKKSCLYLACSLTNLEPTCMNSF